MDLKAQYELDSKAWAIYNAEMARRQRNLAVGYIFLVLGGWLGLHKFYLGKWWGIFYPLLAISGYISFWFGVMHTVSSGTPSNNLYGIFALVVLGLLLIYDLLTLSWQHEQRERSIGESLLNELKWLGAVEGENVRFASLPPEKQNTVGIPGN